MLRIVDINLEDNFMAKHYNYVHASSCQVSNMRCCKCGERITGEYRYHTTPHAHVPCHRECCPEDNMWAKLDKDRKARQDWETAYEKPVKISFRNGEAFQNRNVGIAQARVLNIPIRTSRLM